MKRPTNHDVPPFRKHKNTGQGYVLLDGRRHYLGRFDTPEAKQRYDRLIAEWLAEGRRIPIDSNDVTIVELAAAFWRFAESYYRPPSREHEHYRVVLRHLKAIYGHTRADDFGPRGLKAVRQTIINSGCSRNHTNKQVVRLKRVFKWGVEQELVVPSVYSALQAVAGLKRGKCEARETEEVTPVPDAHVEAVLVHVPPVVAALIRLQLFTAARAGELVRLRPVDIDTTGRVWLYRPQQHKNLYRGRSRTIYLGPKAQAVIQPFLAGCSIDGYLFAPMAAEAWRHAKCETHRRPGQPLPARQTDRTIGDCYTTASYRRCITRACNEAGVPGWTPHRLRHSAGTAIRREFGVEGAQLLLGHARADVTQVYAEVNEAKALEVALKIG